MNTIGTTTLVIAMLVLVLGLSISYATSAQIFRPVPGSITINLVPIEELADIDGNGKVDHRDLVAVARVLNTRPASDMREDINHDGIIDVFDLAIVARYLGREVLA